MEPKVVLSWELELVLVVGIISSQGRRVIHNPTTVVLVVMSKSARRSSWFGREIDQAKQRH